MSNPWIKRLKPAGRYRLKLFCFHHAGGSASQFRPWAARLPADVDLLAVQLPGRAERIREPALSSLAQLTDRLVEALSPELDRPYVFFGHSLGALLAFETASALVQEGLEGPAHLLLSSRRAPTVAGRHSDLHPLADEALIDAVEARYGGLPTELRQERDILELMLPTLRADLKALETHRSSRRAPLDCPITAFAGADDAFAGPDDMQPWAGQTHGGFKLIAAPGGHFHFADDPSALLAEIAAVSAGVRERRTPMSIA